MYTFKRQILYNSDLLSYSNLPYKFFNKELEDFEIRGNDKNTKEHNRKEFAKVKKYIENLEENLLSAKGLFLCGPVGVGKTMLMTIVAFEILKILHKTNVENRELVNTKINKLKFIQGTTLGFMVNNYDLSEEEKKTKRALKTVSVLCIDDISKIGNLKNSNEITFLDDILRHRDLNMLTTLFTSQIPLKHKEEADIFKVFGTPIGDLIRGNCEVIEIWGRSGR